jgi:hypothetical protein
MKKEKHRKEDCYTTRQIKKRKMMSQANQRKVDDNHRPIRGRKTTSLPIGKRGRPITEKEENQNTLRKRIRYRSIFAC